MSKYRKLVRDKVPEIIRNNGRDEIPETCTLSTARYLKALNEKLHEEALEYLVDGTPEELADIYEVIFTLANERHGMSEEDFFEIVQEKRESHGGFFGRIWLERVRRVRPC